MADCFHPCTEISRNHLVITATRITPSGAIPVGQNVNVAIDLKDTSWVYGETAAIDVIDVDTGFCAYSQGIYWVSQGTTVTISFDFPMPDKILKLRISASAWIVPIYFPFLAGWKCEDVKTLTICPSPPQGSCVSTSSSCDESTQIGILGVCLPKNVVFIGVVLFALYYMKNV